MAKKKLKWADTEDLAFRLIDEYPTINPLSVRFTDLHRYVTQLPDFGDDPKKSNEKLLEAIQMTWYEERSEMEDELGPVAAVDLAEDEELDEDEYREDREASDEEEDTDVFGGGDDEDDEEESEFGEGFQEEEIDR